MGIHQRTEGDVFGGLLTGRGLLIPTQERVRADML
jgi:hypothetical protein